MNSNANELAKLITASEFKAKEYAEDVVSGKVIANKWVKLECQRFLDRLERIDTDPECPYFFDYKEVKKINGLLALINYATGFYAGEPVIKYMAGFQFFVIHNVFCLKYKENNARVIEECILLIARKAGRICPYIEKSI